MPDPRSRPGSSRRDPEPPPPSWVIPTLVVVVIVLIGSFIMMAKAIVQRDTHTGTLWLIPTMIAGLGLIALVVWVIRHDPTRSRNGGGPSARGR